VKRATTKLDADEKELSAKGGKRERARSLSLREGNVSQGPTAEHPAVEQGPGGDPEASPGGGLALPDADLEPAAQVRVGTAQRGVVGDIAVMLGPSVVLAYLVWCSDERFAQKTHT
jgi:hypothetical protein